MRARSQTAVTQVYSNTNRQENQLLKVKKYNKNSVLILCIMHKPVEALTEI